MFFSNALIGLREGLEAALVVVILLAFLAKSGQNEARRYVWLGVGVAVALSVALGAFLTFGTAQLSERDQELIGGIASLIAVAFVTSMVLWMKGAAKTMSGELTGRLKRALEIGPLAIALVSFVGVGREGLETAIFFFATVQSAGDGQALPLLGWAVGLGSAVLLGYLIYRGSLTLNLTQFFRWTGIALVVVAAGILAYAVHELQEAGVLPGEDDLAFDFTDAIDPKSWYATLIRGIFNLRPAMSVLSILAWAGYLVVMLVAFLRPTKPAAVAATPAAKEAAEQVRAD